MMHYTVELTLCEHYEDDVVIGSEVIGHQEIRFGTKELAEDFMKKMEFLFIPKGAMNAKC